MRVTIKPPGIGPLVLVFGSIYQAILGLPYFCQPQPVGHSWNPHKWLWLSKIGRPQKAMSWLFLESHAAYPGKWKHELVILRREKSRPVLQVDQLARRIPLAARCPGHDASRFAFGNFTSLGPPETRTCSSNRSLAGAIQHASSIIAMDARVKTNGIPLWLVGEFTTHF